MEIHYTKTYNYIGVNEVKQSIVADSAERLGFKELALFRYPDSCDDDQQLFYRMEGVYSSVSNEATIIMQYPTMVSCRYDLAFAKHIRRYYKGRLIIFVQDLGSSLNFAGYPDLDSEINILNQADLLIFPSEKMRLYLLDHGLKELPYIIQSIWDFPRAIRNDLSIDCEIADFSEDISEYESMNLPVDVGYYLRNGIPIKINDASAIKEYLLQHKLGCVSTEDQMYLNLIHEAAYNAKYLFERGLFTQRLLLDAINMLLN